MGRYNFAYDPTEWQDTCFQIIRIVHGPRVQRVPDKHRGDMGIEAFSTDDRAIIYQCYAPEYPAVVKDRASKIIAKLQSDVPKLIQFRDRIIEHVGARKFKQWVLLVPLFDSKEPLTKCVKEVTRIKGAHLPFIDDDKFDINIYDQTDFASEIQELRSRASMLYRVKADEASDGDVKTWCDTNNVIVETLLGKMERGYSNESESKRNDVVIEYVRWYIDRSNLYDMLRLEHPELWESVVRATASAARRLRTIGHRAGTAQEVLGQQLDLLKADIVKIMVGYEGADVDKLAFGCLAEWLIECLLDFPAAPQ